MTIAHWAVKILEFFFFFIFLLAIPGGEPFGEDDQYWQAEEPDCAEPPQQQHCSDRR